jgi:lysine/ornithine N-monooxygenase
MRKSYQKASETKSKTNRNLADSETKQSTMREDSLILATGFQSATPSHRYYQKGQSKLISTSGHNYHD